jgi:hypothetical protein
MIKILATQFLAQLFDKKKDTKDSLHNVGYNLTMTITEDEFKKIMGLMGDSSENAGSKMVERLEELEKAVGNMKADEITGGYQFQCWSDDTSFTGMLINGHSFPNWNNTSTKMVMLQNVECMCQVRVLKKKDGTSELIVNPLIVDHVGIKPEQTKSKKK